MRFLAFVAMSAGLLMAGCDKDDNGTDNGGDNSSAEWVDLGLPSGLLWCTHNVGATKPEDYGDYFAWGETATKDMFNWITYRYCTVDGKESLSTLTKYNTSTDYGTVDSLTTLEPVDDAATVNLGGGARTPTREEWQELINNTTTEWTTLNGVNGRRLTSTTNGNSIFLPAAGYRDGSEFCFVGSVGNYWSSSLNTVDPDFSRTFYFISAYQAVIGGITRCCGLSVRAVCASQN